MSSEELTDIQKLSKAIRLLDQFTIFDQKMQLMTALILLHISEAEFKGKAVSITEIGKKFGVPTGTASRNIHYWADGHSEKAVGLKLLKTSTNPVDPRQVDITLTSKGKFFIRNLTEVFD